MAKFKVPLETTVTTWLEIEADTLEEALNEAEVQGAPGLMNLDHTYPDVAEWEVPEWFIKENEEEASN